MVQQRARHTVLRTDTARHLTQLHLRNNPPAGQRAYRTAPATHQRLRRIVPMRGFSGTLPGTIGIQHRQSRLLHRQYHSAAIAHSAPHRHRPHRHHLSVNVHHIQHHSTILFRMARCGYANLRGFPRTHGSRSVHRGQSPLHHGHSGITYLGETSRQRHPAHPAHHPCSAHCRSHQPLAQRAKNQHLVLTELLQHRIKHM